MRSAKSRQAYHHGDLKNALMETALQHIAREGARTLSLREVARRTGVSHTASYRHFQSKEGLLAAIAEQGFRRLSDAMHAAMQQHAHDPVAALQASGVAYVEFGVSYPEHLNIMFGIQIAHEEYPALAEASKEAYALLTSIVSEGLQSGGLRGSDERTVTLAAWSIVHGLALLIAGGRLQAKDMPRVTIRELASAVTTHLHEGIAVSPRRTSAKTAARARGHAKNRR
jgi:AcrR family transcriptional regulator